MYDALISRRAYKEGMPHEKAVAIIVEGKGIHFAPTFVAAFMELHEEFCKISHHYADMGGKS